LVPRLVALAALDPVGIIVGALITHAAVDVQPLHAILYGVLAAIIAWGRRDRTAALVASLR